jgi:hypothetical protein
VVSEKHSGLNDYHFCSRLGGAFGQCVFAIVLQKLIDKYEWNGAMMLFSAIVLWIVVFGALFREVEWDEDECDEDESKPYQSICTTSRS